MNLRSPYVALLFGTILAIVFSLTGCGTVAGGSGANAGSGSVPIVAFSATPTAIAAGQSTTLQWQVTGATSVSIAPGIGAVAASGSQTTPPLTQTTTFTLTASSSGGQTAQGTVTITVAQPVAPTVTLTANPASIAPGQLSTLTWSTTNATTLDIQPSVLGEDQTTLPLSGSATVSPSSTTTWTATATGPGGMATVTVQVVVVPMQLNFSANPSTITPGQSATLSWTTQSVQKLVIDNGVGDVSSMLPNGSVTVTPTASTTYTATATSARGTITATAAVTVGAASSGGSIKHIIFMLQENRSFDSYFGQLGPYRASRLQQMGISASPSDVDGTPSGVVLTNRHTGAQVSPYHYQTVCTENLSPSWNESHHDVSLKGGDSAWPTTTTFTSSSFGMKGFLDTTGSVPQIYDPNGSRAMGYYDQTDLPYYYELATQFSTSDRWYSPILANTIPNRMYLFTGTSFGHVRPDSNLMPSTGWLQPTIFAAMNKAGVSWRYYYQDSSVFLADFNDWNDPTIRGKVYNISNWFTILSQSNADQVLPQVVFIERAGETGLDEHPLNNVQKGAAVVQNIIAALMNSTAWVDSVFILSYDEAGGLYDHVGPFQEVLPDEIAPILQSGDIQGTFNVSGMRVPLIVMSPWVKPHFVSHTNRDVTAILKFIEKTFNVPSMTARDAAQDDMSEFFDFSTNALLNAPDGRPWTAFLPQQPTNGVCNQQLESGP